MPSESTLSMTKALNKLQKLQEERLQETSNMQHATSALTPHSQLHTPNFGVHGEVFSINFLRHETMPRRIRRTFAYGAFGYLALSLTCFFYLFHVGSSLKAEGQRLKGLLNGDASSVAVPGAAKQEMATMYQQAVKDLGQLTAAIEQEKSQFPVGGKLAALVKTLPARTWLTKLSGDRAGRRVTVEACYLINPEAPYELPTKRWTDALRADPAFSKKLKRIDLAESSQKMQGKAELFTFELVAEWEK